MAEYAYNRKYKIWYCVENSPFVIDWRKNAVSSIDKHKLLSEEKITELKNARKNKKYLIYDNRIKFDAKSNTYTRLRYPGINCDYIYEDISDLKLIICNGTRYLLMYSLDGCSSVGRIPISYFINNEIVDPSKQDFSVVVEYVERNALADLKAPEYSLLSPEQKKKELGERLKIYYDDLDDDAKLVYNILGSYSIPE